MKSWNGSFFRNHNPSLPFDPYSNNGEGGDNLVTKNELNSQIRFSLRKGSGSNKYIELLGELYVDTLYTVPGELDDAGKRIFTNHDNTKMLIEGDSIPISEDYRTHWFDSGHIRPFKDDKYYPNKLVQVQYAGSITNYYVWLHTEAANVSYTIYTNYNCTKVKCGNQILNLNYKNIQHTLRSAIVVYSDMQVGVELNDGTRIKPGQMFLLYSHNWDSFKNGPNPTEGEIRVIESSVGVDIMNLPFIRV